MSIPEKETNASELVFPSFIRQQNGYFSIPWPRPLFEEFRVVGQICRVGMYESGILAKAQYAMTIFHCME